MDPRLNDPSFRAQLDRQLTSNNSIDKLSAQHLLTQNGIDAGRATAEAKQRQAGQRQAPQPALRPGTPPMPSAPNITAAQATDLVLKLGAALVGTSSIAKFEAVQHCKKLGVSVAELGAHARRVVAEHDAARPPKAP